MTTNATEPQKPASPSPTSVRFDEEELALIDALVDSLDCTPRSRAEAMRRLVRSTAKAEVLELVQEAAFVRLPQLPRVMRYRVVAPFKKLVGIVEVELKRGQVLSLDGHTYEFLADLYARGALLQPLAG